MQPRWNVIIAMCLVLLGIVLAASHGRQMIEFLSAIGRIGPGNDPGQQVTGAVAAIFLAACFLAALRLFLNDRRKP